MKNNTVIVAALSITLLAACGANPENPDCAEDCALGAADANPGPTTPVVRVTQVSDGDGQLFINGELCESLPCEREVTIDTTVTLEVRPGLTSSFDTWSGACGSSAVCEFTATQDSTYEFSLATAGELLAQADFPGIAQIANFTSDSAGNVYVIGRGAITSPVAPGGAGDRDLGYLVKYSPTGTPLWFHILDYIQDYRVSPARVVLGPDGSVYVSSMAFLARPNLPTVERFLLRKVDGTTGVKEWESNGAFEGQHRGLEVDSEGRIYLFAEMDRNSFANFVGSSFVTDGDDAGILAVYTPSGGLLRATQIETGARSFQPGNMIVAPGGGGVFTLNMASGPAMLRFDSTGAIISTDPVPSRGFITQAADGGFLITGSYDQPIRWGEAPELQLDVRPSSFNNRGLFLGKWAADLTPLWIKGFGDTGSVGPTGPVVENSVGDIFLAAFGSRGIIDVGGGALPAFGSSDMVVASYSSAGEHRWSRSVGGAGGDGVRNLDIRGSDLNIYGARGDGFTTELGTIAGGELNASRGTYLRFRQ